eukprot:420392-Rhodomonas_salina.2
MAGTECAVLRPGAYLSCSTSRPCACAHEHGREGWKGPFVRGIHRTLVQTVANARPETARWRPSRTHS